MNKGNAMETDDVKQEICEKYCRYTSGILEIRQEEMDKICGRCPLVRLEKEVCQNEKQLGNNLLYVCSPYRGEIQKNKAYARELTRAAVDSGFAPVAVHLYMTETLDDNRPEERSRGMEAGKKILEQCSFILVGDRYGISEGMKEECALASLKGLTVLYEKERKLYYAETKKEAVYGMAF